MPTKRYKLRKNKGHMHSAMLDKEGNGKSTKVAGHAHGIRGWNAAVADAHTHKVLR